MFNVALIGDRELVARFSAMPAAVRAALDIRVKSLALELQKLVIFKLTGRVLNVRSGALRRSIQQEVDRIGTAIWGKVFSSGDVKYAGIHEFGGHTPPHIIEPKKADAVRFVIGGKVIFAKRVNHPGSKMPERSYLRSSLKQSAPNISRELKEAVLGALMQQAGMA